MRYFLCRNDSGTRNGFGDVNLQKKWMRSLDDPSEISCKDLARIACIREYLQESYLNGAILQIQKSLASFLKESSKETSDLLNRHFLQEKMKKIRSFLQESSKILHFLHFLQDFRNFLQKLCIILQETSKNLASFV